MTDQASGPATSRNLTKRLAVIFYADASQYTRLTRLDEERTHTALVAKLDLLASVIRRNGGNPVQTAGDSMLAEFSTLRGAVTSAVEAQKELAEFAAKTEGVARQRRTRLLCSSEHRLLPDNDTCITVFRRPTAQSIFDAGDIGRKGRICIASRFSSPWRCSWPLRRWARQRPGRKSPARQPIDPPHPNPNPSAYRSRPRLRGKDDRHPGAMDRFATAISSAAWSPRQAAP